MEVAHTNSAHPLLVNSDLSVFFYTTLTHSSYADDAAKILLTTNHLYIKILQEEVYHMHDV